MEKVRFWSEGVQCAGDLFLPGDRGGTARPAIALGQGFGSVKEGVLDQAERLCRAGFVAMAIDYRTFGESEGEPRGKLFPLNEVEDFRNALTYLEGRPEVDPTRLGLWGTSFAGGIVIYAAALDRRVRAVVAQVPVVDGRRWVQALRTTEQWEQLLDALVQDRRERAAGRPGVRIPTIARFSDPGICGLPSDDEIVAAQEFSLSTFPTTRGDIVLESMERVIEYSPARVIDLIGPRALCIITTSAYDIVHPVEHVLDAFERAREPKELVLLPYSQMALYQEPGITEAMSHAIGWFDRHLGPTGEK